MFQKPEKSKLTGLAQETQVFQKRLQFKQEIKSKLLTSIKRVDVMISLPLHMLYAFCTIHTLCMEINTENTYAVNVCTVGTCIVEMNVYMSILLLCMGDVEDVYSHTYAVGEI